jgi:hypothetical protein
VEALGTMEVEKMGQAHLNRHPKTMLVRCPRSDGYKEVAELKHRICGS